MLKIYILGRKPNEIIKNKMLTVCGKFSRISMISRLGNFFDTLNVLKKLFFIENVLNDAFLKGLTIDNHKK